MMRRSAFVMVAAVCVMFCSCGETEQKRRTTGYKGEARSNAFLAAQRLLGEYGYDVDKRRGLGELDYSTSMIFLSPSSLNTVGCAKRLMDWVDEGGHLVFMVSGGEKTGNDFVMNTLNWSMFDEDPSGMVYLFETLGIGLEDWDAEPEDPKLEGMDLDDWESMSEESRALLGSEVSEFFLWENELVVHHWAEKGLVFNIQYEGDFGSEDKPEENKHRFLSIEHGVGRVTVLSDARPLRNRYIGQADHAQLLIDLAYISSRGGRIIFTNGAGDNFFSLLWRHFWMMLVALLIAVIFWLWKSLPRFGPVQDLPEGHMREYLGQVRGIGRFLWGHKRDDALLGAMRRNINRQLALVSGEQHEGIFEQLSERADLPVEQVIEAMTREQIREPGAMVRVTRNLQKIYQHIN